MVNIYTLDPSKLTLWVVFILLGWTFLLMRLRKTGIRNCKLQMVFKLLTVSVVIGILYYTVLKRTPSDSHFFVLIAEYSDEFYREMFMNTLLYVPLGMTLSVFIGMWTIPAGFIMSVLIETWQYFAGTGLAQGTDVLMNTLGCAVGTLPCEIVIAFERFFRI